MLSRPHYPHLQRKQLAAIAKRLDSGELSLEEADQLREAVKAGQVVVQVEVMHAPDEPRGRSTKRREAKRLYEEGVPVAEIGKRLGYSRSGLYHLKTVLGWKEAV